MISVLHPSPSLSLSLCLARSTCTFPEWNRSFLKAANWKRVAAMSCQFLQECRGQRWVQEFGHWEAVCGARPGCKEIVIKENGSNAVLQNTFHSFHFCHRLKNQGVPLGFHPRRTRWTLLSRAAGALTVPTAELAHTCRVLRRTMVFVQRSVQTKSDVTVGYYG